MADINRSDLETLVRKILLEELATKDGGKKVSKAGVASIALPDQGRRSPPCHPPRGGGPELVCEPPRLVCCDTTSYTMPGSGAGQRAPRSPPQ